MILEALVKFIISCIGLVACGSALVRSLSKISYFLRISEFVAGFLIISISTSLPELFVGIQSALSGMPGLSLGTVIGSNIADLTLIVGIAMILSRKIAVQSKTIKKDAMLMVAMATLPLALMYIGKELSRIDGIILLAAFAWFEYRMIKQRRSFHKQLKDHVSHKEAIISMAFLCASILGLYAASKFAVDYAQELSILVGIPPILIGLILLALGTGLPELTFESIAALNNHPDMALGDVIGSVVTNSTLVLGVTALIMPISVDFLLFLVSGLFLITSAIIFTSFVEARYLTWKVGIGLVMLYIIFIIVELEIKGVPIGKLLLGNVN
ncbi:MAG: sodium:calcium antiporter [Nanoarchaeota archaeon]